MAPTISTSTNNNSVNHNKKQPVLATNSQKQTSQSGADYVCSHHSKCIGRYHHHDHDALSGFVKPIDSKMKGETSYYSQNNKALAAKHPQYIPTNSKNRGQKRCTTPECFFAQAEGNNVISSSFSQQQQTSSSLTFCDTPAIQLMSNTQSPINLLKIKLIKKIFSYLNHADLVQCRRVQKLWNTIISQDEQFIDKTTFVVGIQKSIDMELDRVSYTDLLECAKLPFRHGRIQFFDYHYVKEPEYFYIENSDNEQYFPRSSFLKKLTSLELRSSYLLWSTLKRIFVKTVLLEELRVVNCYISEACYCSTIDEIDDFTAGNTIFGLKTLRIHETRFLNNVTKLLKKFTLFNNQNLTTLQIEYYPPNSLFVGQNAKSDCFNFCRELRTLISMCADSLAVLILDIQHEPTLDLVGYHVGKELETLGSKLDLREFQLSPPIRVWLDSPEKIPKKNLAMTMNSIGEDAERCMKEAATSLARFLESQKSLTKLGMPCIEFPEAYSPCFRSMLERISCKTQLEELAIPCAGFLPDDFLHQFPKLKGLKVGASCCDDFTSLWDVLQRYEIKSPRESQRDLPIQSQCKVAISQHLNSTALVVNEESTNFDNLLGNIEALYVSTVPPAENFTVLIKSLCNLTCLEINSGMGTPSLGDADLQACIKYLQNLRILIVSCCAALTDYGITGIPEKYCQLMFKHQKYHREGVKENVWASEKVDGRPLSDLKGLKKLVLMGINSFTDIGIGYGLAFRELQYCHLPYSTYITSWGIARFGKMNPSVHTLVFTGVNQAMKGELQELKRTHARLMKGDTARSRYFFEQNFQLTDNISLILPSPLEMCTTVKAYWAQTINAILVYIRGNNQGESQFPTIVGDD